MRTRSGSLAAVMARVPSHPAHSGVLCICAANASSRSGSRRRLPRLQHGRRMSSTAVHHHRHCKYRAWLAFALQRHGAATSILALVLERWSSTSGEMRTRPLALLPCYSMTLGTRNTAVGAAAMVHNDRRCRPAMGSFNGAFGAFALNNNETGFSNNAMGDSALFRNINWRCEYRCW